MTETVQIDACYEELLRSLGWGTLDGVFAWGSGRRLDKAGLESWRQRWRAEIPGGATADGQILFLKRFNRPPLRRQIERWRSGEWRFSTAGVEWRNARDLRAAGIDAAVAVAFGQEMRGPLEVRSFLVLEGVEGEALERWLPAHRARLENPAFRRSLLDAVARFVAAFHKAGFVHRDLYLSHIFIDAGSRLHLIDLQRVFRPRWRRRRWVVKDLAALDASTPRDWISEPERLRFLSRYLRECGRFGPARVLARSVRAKSDRMRRRAGLDAAAGSGVGRPADVERGHT